MDRAKPTQRQEAFEGTQLQQDSLLVLYWLSSAYYKTWLWKWQPSPCRLHWKQLSWCNYQGFNMHVTAKSQSILGELIVVPDTHHRNKTNIIKCSTPYYPLGPIHTAPFCYHLGPIHSWVESKWRAPQYANSCKVHCNSTHFNKHITITHQTACEWAPSF